MDEYAKIILKIDEKNVDEHLKIAQYFEGKSEWGKAARHYEKSENFQKALKLYISEGESRIPDMIEMVSKVKIDALTHELVDYLMGETDNIPKEPQWTFKLYRAIGNVKQAVKIAINISHQEQEAGNYKYAHDVLLDTYKDIKVHSLKIPFDLNHKLMIIHSYQLAKRHMKMNSHMVAARMLIRVSKNISQFPHTTVNTLTTAVAECTLAGLKKEAYQQACVLIRPENFEKIPPKFKKKVESTARKRVAQEDEPEPLSPCPHCQFMLPETQLECPNCKNNLPFCIASGKHMILSEWSQCPNCKLCCIFSEMKKVLESTPECPMCESQVAPMSLKIADDSQAEFKALVNLMKDPTDNKEEGGEDADSDEDLLRD
uniref:IFT121-like zinc finger domain-containing protein n=1 Tax=Strombidium inclinatum TaxID=197538 RepID=A0A7S3IIZ4_9SPIT|mmetsp:Transcript_21815/g.33751  ORF Transcript_21815/g.33751 Transcript_21815/m.33751 type:complete len:373 (+) Transcript_21815:3080-4198(+)